MLLVLGSVALIVSAVLLVIAISSASHPTYTATIGSLLLNWAANGVFAIGLALILAGCIVRAIWFLPGDETKVPPTP